MKVHIVKFWSGPKNFICETLWDHPSDLLPEAKLRVYSFEEVGGIPYGKERYLTHSNCSDYARAKIVAEGDPEGIYLWVDSDILFTDADALRRDLIEPIAEGSADAIFYNEVARLDKTLKIRAGLFSARGGCKLLRGWHQENLQKLRVARGYGHTSLGSDSANASAWRLSPDERERIRVLPLELVEAVDWREAARYNLPGKLEEALPPGSYAFHLHHSRIGGNKFPAGSLGESILARFT